MTIRTAPEYIAQRYMPGDRCNAPTWYDMHEEPFGTRREAIEHIGRVREEGSQGIIKLARVVENTGEWEFE